jgi:hypothetical protein
MTFAIIAFIAIGVIWLNCAFPVTPFGRLVLTLIGK